MPMIAAAACAAWSCAGCSCAAASPSSARAKRALRAAGPGVQDPERAAEFAPDVGEHREGQFPQFFPGLAPGQVHVLAVDAGAEQLRIALGEFAREGAERGNFGRADEGEVHGPEEHHLPLAGQLRTVDSLKGPARIGRDHPGERVLWKSLSYAQHGTTPSGSVVPLIFRGYSGRGGCIVPI